VQESSSLILASALRSRCSAFPTFLSCLSTCLDISFFRPFTSNWGTAAASASRREISHREYARETFESKGHGEDALDVQNFASKMAQAASFKVEAVRGQETEENNPTHWQTPHRLAPAPGQCTCSALTLERALSSCPWPSSPRKRRPGGGPSVEHGAAVW
jgi:hypothetical protein